MVENILENIWSGIISDQYEAYYQPLYSIDNQKIVGLEALARLNDPKGMIMPAKFISILEKNRMIDKLDLFIFESACKFLKKIKDDNVDLIPISINLSRSDFYDDEFIDKLENIRSKYDVNANLIGIEVTDALALESANEAIDVVKKFHDYGYEIALDNFANNELSLRMIKDINYDIVKVDIRHLSQDLALNNGELTKSIIEKAKNFGLRVIGESVETKEQVEFLKKQECEIAQGYYYAKPMNESNVYSLLTQSEDDINAIKMQERLFEAESYKTRFDLLIEQLDIYYWDYIVATREMRPCYRGIRDFDLPSIIKDCPETFVNKGIIPSEYGEMYIDLYKQIDNGAKHVEAIVPMAKNNVPYVIRCDTEFDENGKAIRAYCSAVKANDGKLGNK